MLQKNCAFQYARTSEGATTIVCDQTELTIDEAKSLWNQYYNEAAMHIKDGAAVEMVIWVDMEDKNSYGKSLQYISHDADSDGTNIWVVTKSFYPKTL